MKAIHVNWTKPYFERHRLRGHGFNITRNLNSIKYEIPNYQILYTILSILRWKQLNGPIKLYTDKEGLEYYKNIGIDILYDEIDTEFLDKIGDVDPAFFWTSGKIQSLENEITPFVFLDQDFIIRGKIPENFYEKDLGIGHWEIPRGNYYFTKEKWNNEIKHIEFPNNYNCNAYSPNTSFLYFKDKKIVNEYVEYHKELIDIGDNEVPEWFWLATDQGILGHVIREGNYKTETLTDKVFLADSDYGNINTREIGLSEQWYLPLNSNMTKDNLEWEHVWLAKVVYGMDEEILNRDCIRFYEEIWNVFPEYNYIINKQNLIKYKSIKCQ